ncbi:MAG TPA: anti-sigma factor antagonist [Rhodobacterales bacterium]|nr:anti-sigma factor antagonist [Rhodobacterales bacterium]
MNLSYEDVGDVRIVTVGEARVDAAIAIQFKDEMRGITEDGPARVVLDMSSVEFLDSSGLGAVVAAMKQVGPGSTLELAGLTPTVAKVFHLTRMDTIFPIHASTAAAMTKLANAG